MRISVRLFRRKSNGMYYVEFDGGKRQSLKTRDAGAAWPMYRRIKRLYLKGRVARLIGECTVTIGNFKKEFVTWGQIAQKKSTFRANVLALTKLIEQCGESCMLDRVTQRHIDQMIAVHKKKGIKTASINNYIRHAKAVFSKAVEWGYLSSSPLKNVKELSNQRNSPTYLKKGEISKFLASIQDIDLRRLATAYIATGRRRSELLGLEWRDIDLESRRYTVRRSKSHLERRYVINSMFLTVLDSLEQGAENERVFPRWGPDAVSHHIKQALVKAGHGHLKLHSLRHSYASMKAEEGRTLREIQELLGHSDIKATMIYTHLTEDHLADISEVNIGPVDLQGEK